MKNTDTLIKELKDKLASIGNPEMLTDCTDPEKYEQKRLVFNRKFEFRPTAIIFVETSEQVSEIVTFANEKKVNISVRSGGHDHEGECSGTDTWLIDFSKMNTVETSLNGRVLDTDEEIEHESEGLRVAIGPGARFEVIKPELDKHHLGIPHGTCQTVGIAGYTMGGGWGPWTRKYGMGCEYLVGATIILGDGSCLELSENDTDINKRKLLWALRGGGGLSYGIVTQFVFRPFVLPKIAFNFTINSEKLFPEATTLEVLKLWENAIQPGNNPNLIGTNLKIFAKNIGENEERCHNAKLGCIMNGYFGGELEELRDMILEWLFTLNKNDKTDKKTVWEWLIDPDNKIINLFSHIIPKGSELIKGVQHIDWPYHDWDRATLNEDGELEIHLDPDCPASHKITSRLANPEWDDSSRKALICSLQSPLLPTKEQGNNNSNIKLGIDTFITLGAITGEYYSNYYDDGILGSAFPYKKQRFTIQYQAWWNQPERNEENGICNEISIDNCQVIQNRVFSNRTEDWMATCRDYKIPHTGGAFISFKDASIPTERYFSDNYEKLIDVKLNCSKDSNLLLRTRKTIL